MNTADAISVMFELVKFVNVNLDKETSKELIEIAYSLLMEMADILALLKRKDDVLEEEIQGLIEKRKQARKDKDFLLADEIRNELLEKKIEIKDTREGTTWVKLD